MRRGVRLATRGSGRQLLLDQADVAVPGARLGVDEHQFAADIGDWNREAMNVVERPDLGVAPESGDLSPEPDAG
jgi:hypothetical protein